MATTDTQSHGHNAIVQCLAIFKFGELLQNSPNCQIKTIAKFSRYTVFTCRSLSLSSSVHEQTLIIVIITHFSTDTVNSHVVIIIIVIIISCNIVCLCITIVAHAQLVLSFAPGQGRADGAICEYTEQDKMDHLYRIRDAGVVNIEMECTAMASLCQQTNVKCAVVCVTLVDRLKGDQVDITPEDKTAWSLRPQQLIAKFIKRQLAPKSD